MIENYEIFCELYEKAIICKDCSLAPLFSDGSLIVKQKINDDCIDLICLQPAVGERFGFDSEDSALGVAEKLHRNGRRRNDMPRFGFGKAASRQRSGPASKGFGHRRLRELQVERIALGFGNDQCVVIHNVIGI